MLNSIVCTFSWCPHGVHTSYILIRVVSEGLQNGLPDPGHDSHTGYNVRTVSQLDAYLGQGGSHWTHAEGNHIHGLAFHAFRKSILQVGPEVLGRHPVVEEALHSRKGFRFGVAFLISNNHSLALHASNVLRICSGVPAGIK